MPRKRPQLKQIIVEFRWNTFMRYDGNNQKEQIFNAMDMIIDKIGVKCEVNFGSKKKGVYEDANETTYWARFTSKSAFKLELAQIFVLAEKTRTIYNKRSNESYKIWYNSTYSNPSSSSISDIGDSEYESESNDELEEHWEKTCEICGTKKSSKTPFEVTKCRNLDMSIVDNLINNMRNTVDNTYMNFKESDYQHNKVAFRKMLDKFDIFTDKFTKWCKFSFAHESNLGYLLKALTNVDNISKYTFEQIKSLNTRLVEFYTKLDSAQLSI